VEARLDCGLSIGPTPRRLDPYKTILMEATGAITPPGGVVAQVAIFDPSRGPQAGDPVAEFVAIEHWSEITVGDVLVQDVKVSGNYQLSAPLCNEGGFYKYPGAIQATIFGA
jgi:hypothetical protein